MRVVLLGSADCIHSVRWANGLASHGVRVDLVSAHPVGLPLEKGVTPHILAVRPPYGYITNTLEARRLINRLNPDLVNSHYASGYGTLGRLVGHPNTVLSVWGADVFDFPRRSRWHRTLVAKNMLAASRVSSISHVMAKQCKKICPSLQRLEVVPWGVDTSQFAPPQAATGDALSDTFTIGTVKALKPKYGIDTLIKAFAACRKLAESAAPRLAEQLRLRIVGDGFAGDELRELARRVGVDAVCEFVPAVSHDRVPEELHKLDLYVAASRFDSESFGVAIVEALACERPVIVSDAGGLPEVIDHGRTGLVVERENPEQLAGAMLEIASDPVRGKHLAEEGRRDVLERFEWDRNVDQMIDLFGRVASARRIAA